MLEFVEPLAFEGMLGKTQVCGVAVPEDVNGTAVGGTGSGLGVARLLEAGVTGLLNQRIDQPLNDPSLDCANIFGSSEVNSLKSGTN